MDPTKLVRNAAEVHKSLVELDDNRLVTKRNLKIYIPSRFAERGLADIGIDIYIIGICAIVVDDKYYAVSMVNAMWRITPTSTMKVMINDDEYYEFSFEPGSTVLQTTYLVKNDQLVYRIYDEIIAKGRKPWYLGYLELAKLFDTASYHAGANIGRQHETMELIISLIARSQSNRHLYYRSTITDINDLVTNPPAIVPLMSVIYGGSNTLNKLAGSYFSEGMVSSLVSPTERKERIEDLLTR
jgi:hypothetical protein